jgi:Cysteine-rich CWC
MVLSAERITGRFVSQPTIPPSWDVDRLGSRVGNEQDQPIDPARCPLCGAPNACAMAANPDSTRCWCFEVTIALETLERVPPEARGAACICARCAAALREEPS